MKTKWLNLFLLAAIPVSAASISSVWVNPCLVVKGQECTIEWTRTGPMAGQVNITLWLAGIKRAEMLNVPNPEGNNEKSWMVPVGLPTGKYVLRVATTDGQFQGESEHFLDQMGMVFVGGPSGTVFMGASVSYAWHGFGLGLSPPTYHDLYRNGALVGRIGSNDMSHSSGCGRSDGWIVGRLVDANDDELVLTETVPTGSGYRIRVRNGSGQYYCESAVFAIAEKLSPILPPKTFKLMTRIPVCPVPGCPMCGEVQLEELWKIFESSPEVQEIQLWQGNRMLGKLIERGGAARRLAGRRIEFGDAFAKLRQGGAGFELRLFAAGGRLLRTQAVALSLQAH